MLDHANLNTFCEDMCCVMELLKHFIDVPPPQHSDCICVNLFQYQEYGPLGAHQVNYDDLW